MIKNKYLIILLVLSAQFNKRVLSGLLLWMIPFIMTFGQVSILTFEGKFSLLNLEESETPGITYPRSKQTRLSSQKGGQLKAVYNKSVMKALHPLAPSIIDHAVKLWEERIYIPENVVIDINFELGEMGNDLAYIAAVSHHDIEGIRYPIALVKAYFNAPLALGTSVITFNSNSSNWYFDGDNDNPSIQSSQYDFKTAVLRSIAQALGFITTIRNKRGTPMFSGVTRSVFEKFVLSDNKALADIGLNASSELLSFVTNGNVYWNNDPAYKLYSPPTYEPDYSLHYFDSQNELMSAHFKAQKGVWDIDDKTVKVLEDIGWKTPLSSVQILSNDIDNNGIGSIYSSYSFYIGSASSFNSYLWEYKVRLKDGGFQTLKTGDASTFSISPVTPLDTYYRNSEGDIVAKIDVKAVMAGITYDATFNLALECKPENIEYEVNIIKVNDWYYDIEIVFSSAGAENMHSTVTDYSIGEILGTTFSNKQYVKYTTHYYSYGYPVSIQLRADNSYGTATASYYIEPFEWNSQNVITKSLQNELNNLESIAKIEVVNFNGLIMNTFHSKEDLKSLNPGIYLLRIYSVDGSVAIKKIIK